MNNIIIIEILQYGNNEGKKITHIEYVIKKCNCKDLYIKGAGNSGRYRCYCTYVKQMREYTHPFFSEHNINISEKIDGSPEDKGHRELIATLVLNHLNKYFESGNIELEGEIFDFTKEQIEAAIVAEKLLKK